MKSIYECYYIDFINSRFYLQLAQINNLSKCTCKLPLFAKGCK